MDKIGTHNSATGEKGKGVLSLIGTPFARCQTKTIREQYNEGCRFFDLRTRKINKYEGLTSWHCAHGFWVSSRSLCDFLDELDNYDDICHVTLTYEGSKKSKGFEDFKKLIQGIESVWKTVDFVYFAVKKPKWVILHGQRKKYPLQGFTPITGWRCLLPIPWLWHKLSKTPKMNENKYTLVDFL